MAGRPAWLNITLYQGDDFELELWFLDREGAPIDVTGRTWSAQYRTSYEASGNVPFTVDTTNIADGKLVLRLSKEDVALIGADGVWDLAETEDGETSRLLMGEVDYVKTVTR